MVVMAVVALEMGDDNDRDTKLFVDTAYQLQDRIGRSWVESTGSFITKQHLRIGRKRTVNRHPLLLSAGELCGIGFCLIAKSYDIQQFKRSFLLVPCFYRQAPTENTHCPNNSVASKG